MATIFSLSANTSFIDRLFTNTSLSSRLLHRLDLTNLRHIFYLITPYETSVSSLDQVPNYNIQVSAWWMTLIFLEFVLLYLSGHEDRFALNDSMTSIFAGMLSQCFKFGGELPWDSPWTWLLCFVFQDFVYYLGHRAIHECGFFWGLHTIHHSSEYYNLSTALRQAAIQDLGLAAYDVLQAFCIPPPIFLVHRYFSEIFQFWMHTSLLGSLGPLGYILNTPSHHRVHHGRNAYCIDRNFGGVLIIWDRMFHTFEAEREDDPPVYGLITNEKTFNQLWLQFHTLKELLLDKWRLKKGGKGKDADEPVFKGVTGKLKALFYPPGYVPGVQVFPFFHWFSLTDHTVGVPQIEYPVIKYNPPLQWWIKAYCLVHFLLLLSIFLHFEYDRGDLDYWDFCLKLTFFVCTMQSFGAFFDNLPYAPFLEIFRCIGVIGFYAAKILLDKHGFLPNRIFMLVIFISSSLLWIGYTTTTVVLNSSRVQSADANVESCEQKKSDVLTFPVTEQPNKVQMTESSQHIVPPIVDNSKHATFLSYEKKQAKKGNV
uniref:Alkylglycerol monooxygenase n=1 Tax=Ditylenchus dipsaci TaxID=166011 RepID=A0A915D3T5_9BILA